MLKNYETESAENYPGFYRTESYLEKSFLSPSTVKSIDIARTVELFDQSSVDEVSWVGGLRRGDLVGEFGENHFEAVESRVGFSRHEAAQDLVGIVQIPFLLQTYMFAQCALGYL